MGMWAAGSPGDSWGDRVGVKGDSPDPSSSSLSSSLLSPTFPRLPPPSRIVSASTLSPLAGCSGHSYCPERHCPAFLCRPSPAVFSHSDATSLGHPLRQRGSVPALSSAPTPDVTQSAVQDSEVPGHSPAWWSSVQAPESNPPGSNPGTDSVLQNWSPPAASSSGDADGSLTWLQHELHDVQRGRSGRPGRIRDARVVAQGEDGCNGKWGVMGCPEKVRIESNTPSLVPGLPTLPQHACWECIK